MKRFANTFYQGVEDGTFLESCGVGDLITTCYNGRNRRLAEVFVKSRKSFEVLEKELLNGQHLQGPLTAKEVNHFLKNKNKENEYFSLSLSLSLSLSFVPFPFSDPFPLNLASPCSPLCTRSPLKTWSPLN
jgi:glycerol-3-phosphate dehydrogenase (NAD+)